MLGLGVAPGLGGAAVAEFLAVPLFMPHDEHGLMIDLAVPLAGDVGAGDDHGGIVGMFALTADFGVVVVDVLKDVAQTDAVRMTHDAHLVHGRELVLQLAFDEEEQILKRGHFGLRLIGGAGFKLASGFVESGLKKRDVFLMLAGKDVLEITESVGKLMQLLFPFHHKNIPS